MKIGIATPNGCEVHLPVEIIRKIIRHIRSGSFDTMTQYALWSCCLISQSWYAATVSYLYGFPLLTNKNFENFARTLCPPVSSRARRVGLENFVVRLDMGGLAYESSKSLTARLLRRTRNSLHIFVAPAVSFSVNCLAPLSKCHELRILDLSRDFYDLSFHQVLHAVKDLQHLERLSLPKCAFQNDYSFDSSNGSENLWPPNLSYLQMNRSLPKTAAKWEELISSLPPKLETLAVYGTVSSSPLSIIHGVTARSETMYSMYVGEQRCGDIFPIYAVLKVFPRLKTLGLPHSSLSAIAHFRKHGPMGLWLEHLDVQSNYEEHPSMTLTLLHEWLKAFPELKRVDMPEGCLNGIDDIPETVTIEELEKIIEQRAKRRSGRQYGIFLHSE